MKSRRRALCALTVPVVLIAGGSLAGCGNIMGGASAADSGGLVTETSTFRAHQVDACDILTEDVANELLVEVSGPPSTLTAPDQGSSTHTTNCTYVQSPTISADFHSAGLMVRAATSRKGALTNQRTFADSQPDAAQSLTGYGDAAYWNPQLGQLNILSRGNWYVLTNGPAATSQSSLTEVQGFADIIAEEL